MTDRNKKFLTKQVGNLYIIYLEGGGELPNKLKGLWTSPNEAEKGINRFLRDEDQKRAEKEAKRLAEEEAVTQKKTTRARAS